MLREAAGSEIPVPGIEFWRSAPRRISDPKNYWNVCYDKHGNQYTKLVIIATSRTGDGIAEAGPSPRPTAYGATCQVPLHVSRIFHCGISYLMFSYVST